MLTALHGAGALPEAKGLDMAGLSSILGRDPLRARLLLRLERHQLIHFDDVRGWWTLTVLGELMVVPRGRLTPSS